MKENKLETINAVVLVCGVAFALFFVIPAAFPEWTDEGKWNYYQFDDNSVCPCQLGSMVLDENCNEEIQRFLDKGYAEVRFCENQKVKA